MGETAEDRQNVEQFLQAFRSQRAPGLPVPTLLAAAIRTNPVRVAGDAAAHARLYGELKQFWVSNDVRALAILRGAFRQAVYCAFSEGQI